MKYSELKKILIKNGCRFDHSGGRHEIWYSPITKKYFPWLGTKRKMLQKELLNQY